MTYQWVDCDRNFLVRRYNRIAGLIPFFEWLFFLPAGLRRNAVDRLELKPGDSVLEVGCGTGRNLPFLCSAVGSRGRVYGVDLSPGMLSRAHELTARNRWTNVALTQADAIDYVAPRRLDGVLFSLSYNTIPHHHDVLCHVWNQLRPGGSLVIMDAKPPPGRWGECILPLSVWLMKRTVLGNPYIQPWTHLATLTENFEMEEFLFGSYYICRGIRRERRSPLPNGRSLPATQLDKGQAALILADRCMPPVEGGEAPFANNNQQTLVNAHRALIHQMRLDRIAVVA